MSQNQQPPILITNNIVPPNAQRVHTQQFFQPSLYNPNHVTFQFSNQPINNHFPTNNNPVLLHERR